MWRMYRYIFIILLAEHVTVSILHAFHIIDITDIIHQIHFLFANGGQ